MFKNNVPVSPIKALLVLKPNSSIKIEYLNIDNEDESETQVQATLSVDKENFVGIGGNKTVAKAIVYKKAVRAFDTTKNIIFF